MIPYNGFNAIHHRNEEAEALFKKQAVEFDPEKRAEIIKKLNKIFMEEAWFIPTIHGVANAALNIKKWRLDTTKEPLAAMPLTWISKK